MSDIEERLRRSQEALKLSLAVQVEHTQKLEAEIERLKAAVQQACRQWKMYADMEDGRDLATEQSPEGELYRAALEGK